MTLAPAVDRRAYLITNPPSFLLFLAAQFSSSTLQPEKAVWPSNIARPGQAGQVSTTIIRPDVAPAEGWAPLQPPQTRPLP